MASLLSVGPHGRACPPRDTSPDVAGRGATWDRGTRGTEGSLRGGGGRRGTRVDAGRTGGTQLGSRGGGWGGADRQRGNGAASVRGGKRVDVGEAPRPPSMSAPRVAAEGGHQRCGSWGGSYSPPSLPLPSTAPRTRVGSRRPPDRHSRVTTPRGPPGDPPRVLLLLLLLHSRRR